MQLARAYIRPQQYTARYSPLEALQKGTIFPELYMPYDKKRRDPVKREAGRQPVREPVSDPRPLAVSSPVPEPVPEPVHQPRPEPAPQPAGEPVREPINQTPRDSVRGSLRETTSWRNFGRGGRNG